MAELERSQSRTGGGKGGRVKSKLKEKRLVMGVGVKKTLIELCRSTEGSGGADSDRKSVV